MDRSVAVRNTGGRVEVRRALEASPAEAWRAITEPAAVGQWLGSLRDPLRPGATATLDFGDGDFFTLHDIRLESPVRLEYAWRFLGTGPLDAITWQVVPAGRGCEVTVADEEPGRSPEQAAQQQEGWLDFTDRLARFLATGQRTRYDWRREFDGAIELAVPPGAAWHRLFDPPRYAKWLPLGGGILEDGAPLALGPDPDPESDPPTVSGVRWEPRDRVSFSVGRRDWLRPTDCELRLSPRGGGAILSVRHTGWESISRDVRIPPDARKCFAALWVDALRRAARLTGSVVPVCTP
jgi:uncharacterized protein YndB with AHSA1/START domain